MNVLENETLSTNQEDLRMSYVTRNGEVTFYVRSTGETVDAIQKPLDWQIMGLSKTATGYGKKIPTSLMINYEGRLRRVYQDVYSNSGVSYIIVKGQKVTLA